MRYQREAIPALNLVEIKDVQVGDIFWGLERDANYPRKGWLVEPEGEVVNHFEELEDRWVINSTHFLKGYLCPEYILIEAR